mmetsp:Transcript_8272/g.28407  ORF Transcript_8272/g.28407 Transcript_8272/m.28407 type:complete len:205 (+) Transcript_8272:151-765(+)
MYTQTRASFTLHRGVPRGHPRTRIDGGGAMSSSSRHLSRARGSYGQPSDLPVSAGETTTTTTQKPLSPSILTLQDALITLEEADHVAVRGPQCGNLAESRVPNRAVHVRSQRDQPRYRTLQVLHVERQHGRVSRGPQGLAFDLLECDGAPRAARELRVLWAFRREGEAEPPGVELDRALDVPLQQQHVGEPNRHRSRLPSAPRG